MALEREVTDGITGEEVVVTLSGIRLFNATNFEWNLKQPKTLLKGLGKPKAFGRSRGGKTYEASFTITEINMALLEDPADFRAGQGDVKTFTIDGVEYNDLCDLRNLTITVKNPDQEGTRIKRRLKGFEFNEDSGSVALEEAVSRSLSGEATSAEGLI